MQKVYYNKTGCQNLNTAANKNRPIKVIPTIQFEIYNGH